MMDVRAMSLFAVLLDDPYCFHKTCKIHANIEDYNLDFFAKWWEIPMDHVLWIFLPDEEADLVDHDEWVRVSTLFKDAPQTDSIASRIWWYLNKKLDIQCPGHVCPGHKFKEKSNGTGRKST